jgi:predicted nucleic acid-binding protein
MTGFLLDTNIPSELTRPRPQTNVVRWLEDAEDQQLHLSVISLGEILKGITVLAAGERRAILQQWLDRTLRPWFQGRILPVTDAIAARWGSLSGECQLREKALNMADGLIAATALEHGLTLVTRNTRDFEGVGLAVFNPWES